MCASNVCFSLIVISTVSPAVLLAVIPVGFVYQRVQVRAAACLPAAAASGVACSCVFGSHHLTWQCVSRMSVTCVVPSGELTDLYCIHLHVKADQLSCRAAPW